MRQEQRYADAARPTLERLVNLIDGVRFKPGSWNVGGSRVAPSEFTGACLLDFHDLTAGDVIYVAEDVFDVWPVRVRAVTTDAEAAEAVVHSLSSVTPKQARGKVKHVSPRMLKHSWANITGTHGETFTDFYRVNPDESLSRIKNSGGCATYNMPAREQHMVRVLAGIAMWLEYQWTVRISATGSNFAVTIPTSPEGARKLLSLRDIPAGAERRRALRHWVSEHTRRLNTRDGDVREVDVREHLRGVQLFTWDDLHGEVTPSKYDLVRAAS